MPVRTSIAKRRGKARVKIVEKRRVTQETVEQLNSDDLDVTIGLIQALIPCGLKAVEEKLQAEVEKIAGRKHKHGKENVRWGRQAGSVYLSDQKIPTMVPRVRNKADKKEVELEAYHRFQQPYQADQKTMLKLLNGISTRKYRQSAELVPEVFGISPSNLSKRFKKSTADMVRMITTRSLSGYDFVCIFIDGKRYAKDGLMVALGITIQGDKVILGVEQTHTENSTVMEQFLDKLIERGLKYEDGLLFIVDGSKGIIAAIEDKFNEYGFIQRCRWHKQNNVTGYLNDTQKELCRRRLKEAYYKTTYAEAKAGLESLYRELANINLGAANSLAEGMEETLTLHRLGLAPELCKSLGTTNCIESIMAQLGSYTDKVDRWHNSYQLLRWTSAGLLQIEPNLNKIRGFRYLNLLRLKMKDEIQKRKALKYPKPSQQHQILQPVGV